MKLDFIDAFKYPFNRAKGMFNILWLFLPIFGWFALGGYGVRIVQEFVKGQFKQLPEMNFSSDMKFGFFMFLKAIPFLFVYTLVDSILGTIPFVGFVVVMLLGIFVVPILSINFMKKETVESFFEFDIVKVVFDNLGDYAVAVLKGLGLFLVFLPMVIVLVGIPGIIFTQNMFLADFYRRNVK